MAISLSFTTSNAGGNYTVTDTTTGAVNQQGKRFRITTSNGTEIYNSELIDVSQSSVSTSTASWTINTQQYQQIDVELTYVDQENNENILVQAYLLPTLTNIKESI